VCDIADKTQPVAGADHLGAEYGEPLMGDGTGLKVADVVWRVMNQLQVAQPESMRFLQPLELAVEEIEPFDIPDNRRCAGLVRGFEVGGTQRPANAVMRHQLVHPGKTFKMVR